MKLAERAPAVATLALDLILKVAQLCLYTALVTSRKTLRVRK